MSEHTRAWAPVILPAEFRPPVGAYSPAVRAGNLVFVSGQVPKDPWTGQILPGDVRRQTKYVFANLERVLNAAGATLDDIVSVTAYLANMEDWEPFNEEYRDLLKRPYPARTTVGAQLNGFLVEISVIAVVP
jgi:2-iminobutanoate/2-iminopropanoate deaminase